MKTAYWATKNGTHQISGNPLDLNVRIVDKRIWDIVEVTNCVNGTFYWYDDKYKTFPTSILVIDGQIIRGEANHEWDFGCPQSVFVVYKDGLVAMYKVKHAIQIPNLNNVKLAIGGVGLVNKLDPTFKYDPASEGFKERYADVLAKRNKTVLAYNKKEDKVYLMVRANIYHKHWLFYDLLNLVRDCEYDIAISLDGGGSTFMDANNKYVFHGEAGRRINNIVGFFV